MASRAQLPLESASAPAQQPDRRRDVTRRASDRVSVGARGRQSEQPNRDPHAASVIEALAALPRKSSAARFASLDGVGESDRKSLAEPDCARIVGRAIEAGLVWAGMEKKEAAARMGHADQSSLSRWVAGVETANFAKLLKLGPKFRQGFVLALADGADGIEIKTVVTIARTA